MGRLESPVESDQPQQDMWEIKSQDRDLVLKTWKHHNTDYEKHKNLGVQMCSQISTLKFHQPIPAINPDWEQGKKSDTWKRGWTLVSCLLFLS